MPTLYDHRGQAVSLGRQLGKGGEGSVFEIVGSDRFVAKLYHAAIPRSKIDKLEAMVRAESADLFGLAAWPLATLHRTPGASPVGLLMPRVDGHEEIHNLFSPAHRKVRFPRANWAFLVHVAMNCAAAVEAIHSKGHVVGDINQGNFLVSQRGTVFLIDCDSFQIASAGKLFPCEVGVAHYTPPELQGQNFRGIHRTGNHDCFGLAVIIFQLLFMGRHPFAGRYLGQGDMPIERSIAESRFAFSQNAPALQMAPPPQSLTLGVIGPQVADSFERAFQPVAQQLNGRPSAGSWRLGLQMLGKQLKQCSVDRGHVFPSQLDRCPWCVLMSAGAPNFFISVAYDSTSSTVFETLYDVRGLWRQIDAITAPTGVLGQLPTVRAKGRALSEYLISSRQFASLIGAIAGSASLVALATFFASKSASYITLPLACAFVVWWLLLQVMSPFGAERLRRRRKLSNLRRQLGDRIDNYNALASSASERYAEVLRRLGGLRAQYTGLKKQFDQEMRQLESKKAEKQLALYLQGVFIADHKISNIGPGRKTILASNGIETAFDVDSRTIESVQGFGPSLASNLLAWRKSMEGKFKFDPAQGIPKAEVQALVLKFVQIRQHLESQMNAGPRALDEISVQTKESLAILQGEILELNFSVAQAEADVRVLQ